MPEGLVEEGAQAPLRSWFADIAATLDAPHLANVALLAVELITGRVLGATDAARELLGPHLPADLDELVERGTVARPDLDRLRRRARRAGPPEPGEHARAWDDELRLHHAGASTPVHLHVLHHRRPQWGGEVVVLTLTPRGPRPIRADDRAEPDDRERASGDLWSILDGQGRTIALEPGWEALWADPQRTVGTLVAVLVHPEDLAEILPTVHRVFNGELDRCSFTARLAADDGRWVTVQAEHRAMALGGERVVVTRNRIVDESRRLIVPGELSPREVVVVDALFEGLRVAQIAERDGVSVRTVRNQLRSVYRKLDVTGQADLLSRYHRPA